MLTDRDELSGRIREATVDLPWLVAAWLGGSDATGRVDELSDVDLQLVVEDECVEDAFIAMEGMLERAGGVDHRWRVDEPTWHGHAQAVYRPRGAPAHLCLDLLVIRRSAEDWFVDRARHGDALVLIDRDGRLATREPGRERLAERRQALLAHHARSLPVVMETVAKSIHRGNLVEAVIGYHQRVLVPLIDLVRCEHCPDRFDFGPRYLDRDLPESEQRMLEELAASSGPDELSSSFRRARSEIMARLKRLNAMDSEGVVTSVFRER